MTLRRVKWLDEVVCNHINDFYDFSEFEDGKVSGTSNRDIKRNTQMMDVDMRCTSLFMDQFRSHPFTNALSARHVTSPLFLKYSAEEESHYYFHCDSAIMEDLRSDCLLITAINDESEYEGGDLIIRIGSESIVFRLKKGEGLLMDPSNWHAVTPVTKGERRVAVLWAEHLIQDAWMRELYYEFIDLTHRALNSIDPEKWKQHCDIDSSTYFNGFKFKILRQYANPYHSHHVNPPNQDS